MKLVVILRGIPGSGKSTLAKNRFPMAVTVSADNFFMVEGEYRFDPTKISEAHRACWRAFYDAVQSEAPMIVVDNTSISLGEVSPYVLPAEANGYQVKVMTITCDADVAAARNVHNVPPPRHRDDGQAVGRAQQAHPAVLGSRGHRSLDSRPARQTPFVVLLRRVFCL